MYGKEGVSESTRDDIQAFESKGYELGAEPKLEAVDPKAKKPPPSKGKKEGPPAVFDPAVIAQQGKAYLEDVKARKGREDADRFQHRQNIRKEELEKLEREKEAEEARKKEEEEQTVQKRLEEELRQAEILRMQEAELESMHAYRRNFELQIAEQRQREWDAVLARDRELLIMMRQDCFDEVEHEHQLVEAEKKRKAENRKTRHREMCREVILQITSLAESRACYRESTNSDLPMLEWREWQTLFVKGAIMPSPLCSDIISTESQTEEENRIADEAAAMEYFQEQGEWNGVQPIGKNKELGIILHIIHTMADVPPKPLPIPHFSEWTLKLATVGIPYSGRSTIATKIATEFGIKTIEMDKILAAAIAEAEAEEANQPVNAEPAPETPAPDTPAPVNEVEPLTVPAEGAPSPVETVEVQPTPPPPPTKAQLGKAAKQCKQQGQQVPDEVMVTLLVMTISNLHATEDEKAPPKKPLPKDKKGGKGAEPEINVTGFILDGFPNTAGQAAALEKALTGLDFEFTARHEAEASVLAPPPPIIKVDKFVSGLDGIFLMECPNEERALNKALGKRVDSKTGLFYHLDYDPPPPTDKTGIASRLQPVEEPDLARIRIVEGLQLWPALTSWMSKFLNAFWVGMEEDGKVKPEDASNVVKDFVAAKVQADAAAAAAKAAREAEEATNLALGEAEKAKVGCDIASKQLYFAKVGEIEAAAVLESFPADPLAKETLRVKASTMAGQKLNEAVKALKEIQNPLEVTQKAAAQAQEAATRAQEAVGGADACFQAKADAEAAAEAAKQAASRASVASQKAGFAFEAASSDFAKVEKPEAAAAKGKQQEEAQDVSSGETAAAAEPAPEYPEIDLSTAVTFHSSWKQIESLYFSCLKNLFHSLRVERVNGRNILQEIKMNFGVFLKRPDNKQKTFDDFQAKYNRIEIDQRRQPKMKQTLKKTVDDLAKQLRTICDQRLKEAQENCKKVLADWIGQRTSSCISLFTNLIQTEIDRHLQTCAFLHEVYFRKPSSAVMETFNPVSNLVETAQVPPKTFPVPGWIPGVTASSPQISQIVTKALFLIDGIIKAATDPELDNRAKAGGKSKPPPAKSKPGEGDGQSPGPSAMLREHEIIQSRLQLLASKACTYMGELQPLVNGSSARMEKWMNNCNKVESEIVTEVIELSNEAVEEAIPLWYQMNLDGGELVINEEHMMVDPPPQLAVQPVIDVNKWHFKLLRNLVEILRTMSLAGYIETEKATSTLLQAVQTAHAQGKEDVEFAQVPHLPATKGRPFGPFQIWLDYTNNVMKKVPPAKTEAETVQILDWRALIMTLADIHFNDCISASSVENVKQVCSLLEETSKDTDGLLSLESFVSVPFWFDQAVNQGAADIGTELKTLAYQMLVLPPLEPEAVEAPPEAPEPAAKAPEPTPTPAAATPPIPWQRLALYFCRDEDKEKALSKVFQVLLGTGSDVLELRPEQLLQAIYHLSLDEASTSGCLAWAPQDIRELILKIKSELAPQAVDEGDDVDSDGSQGSGRLCTRSTVAQRGSNLSEQTNITVRDFGVPENASLTEVLTEASSIKGARDETCSELSDQAVETIQQFLDALSATPREEAAAGTSPAILPPGEVVERQVSVKEILSAQCAANLCSILLENYCSKQIHVMNVKKADESESEGSRPKEEFAPLAP
ncbi:sperm flagellar protein 2-like [Selaginella moellendorffii]|uniref:sperm flagellar protein 2-like n=1 Tax=Selaginella moellendorffii TaxID=88036 RepID=UPI000D1CE18D|nr:sperm flagellar protein 2-like [Selaginella moellendorffii]|eukprot:XP_024520804.1 sperm flagellar protein 2-like [Selaginella moellendorffii]